MAIGEFKRESTADEPEDAISCHTGKVGKDWCPNPESAEWE